VIGLTATGDNDPAFGNAGVQTLAFTPYSPVADAGPAGAGTPFRGLPKIQSDSRGRWVVAGFGEHVDAELLDGDPPLARLRYYHVFRDGLE